MKRLIMALIATGISLSAMSHANAADAVNGKKVYEEECSDCHSTNAGKNKKGPSFFNLVGRKSGPSQ